MCVDCVTRKMRQALEEPIPNTMKCEEQRMKFLGYNQRTGKGDEYDQKINALMEDIDVYDIETTMEKLDIIDLYKVSGMKTEDEKSAERVWLKRLPNTKLKDNQKRAYENMHNVKTIFDRPEIT